MSRLRKSGGYRDLRTFRSATLIYDATYWFCEKYLNPRSRTVDQMVQAARSAENPWCCARRRPAKTPENSFSDVPVTLTAKERRICEKTMNTDTKQQIETALRAFSGADLRFESIGLSR